MTLAVGLLAALFPSASRAQMRFDEVHRMLPWTAEAVRSIALGDVDGDGDLDALFGSADPTGFHPDRLVLNDGTGLFVDASGQLPSVQDVTYAVALGDVDGDGDLDALIGNAGGSLGEQSHLYLNDGAGFFTPATTQIPSVVAHTFAVALGDVDGDGDLDAFLGNGGPSPEQNRLYVNDGMGVYADATAQIPAIPDGTRAVALGDVDGDGDLDFFLGEESGSFGGAQDRLFLNDGSGDFTDAPAQLPAILDRTLAAVLVDVDGDTDLDLLIANGLTVFAFGQPRLYLNDGAGRFSDATSQLPAITGYYDLALAAGDVDGDGDVDAFCESGSFPVVQGSHLLLNGGGGVFIDATSQIPAAIDSPTSVALGDVDGDGDLDAVIGEAGHAPPGEPDRLYLNDGSGQFTDASGPFPGPRHAAQAVALEDVDGDGDLDAVLGGSRRLLLNDGLGSLAIGPSAFPFTSNVSYAVALGDVDGDGDPDGFFGNVGQSEVLLNNGSGTFAASPVPLPSFLVWTFAVALGDVDGDGDLDAMLGNGGTTVGPQQQSLLYLNVGSGGFADATAQLPAVAANTHALDLGDMDADGDLDAVIGLSGSTHLYRNSGSGVFADDPAAFPPVFGVPEAVALGDVDGDGDLDVLTGAGVDRLFLNGGGGVFADATSQLPVDSAGTEAVTLGDVDGDGDLDALLGDSGNGQQDRLYLNDGSGAFTDATNQIPAVFEQTKGIALGDVDGDGDLDALIANENSPNRLLTNLTRHLAWRGLPRIGKPLTLDLYGPPGGAWALGAAVATANIPVGSVGTLRLDPPSVFAVVAGSLDGAGRASISFGVPPNPALVGFSVYWQGMVAGPLRFTNLEVTALTSY
ncbi:MAG TPA: VCBS repeat-containing protein [Planctomycetota bacterium]|jgi:hypothetical protein|nr:VCBS repeat-containing protein [Planctomycetota bacterium]